MSRTFYGLEDEVGPGTLVYESFYPQNPGIVRRVVLDVTVPLTDHAGNIYSHRRDIVVEVEWRRETKKRKKVTDVHIMSLQSFEALIEEHERKFKKQSAMADELRKL